MPNITLFKRQKKHVARMLRILKKHRGVGDTSIAGAGKTITILYLTKLLKLKPFVVCKNSSNVTRWREVMEKYGIEYAEIINYEKLGGREKTGCKNPWIIRNVNRFSPSKRFVDLAKTGILLIFDEVQYVKRGTAAMSRASHSLVRGLSRTKSRVCFLSNTPFDKRIFAGSIIKILGIITREKMYDFDKTRNQYVLSGHGLSQLMQFCRKRIAGGSYNSKVDEIKKMYPLDKKNVKILAYELYKNVIRDNLLSSMPGPKSKYPAKFINKFYTMSKESEENIRKGYRILRHYIDTNGRNCGTLSQAQTLVELGKIQKITEIVAERIEKYPNKKFIVFAHRISSMDFLYEKFKKYGSLKMNSHVTGQDRDDVITKFQNNDGKYRFLVTSTQVSGDGIELDDQYGGHPREVYIVPSYKYISDYQASRRVYRTNTKSVSLIYFVYCDAFPEEKVLINQIKKSDIHEEVVYKPRDILKVTDYIEEYEKNDGRVVEVKETVKEVESKNVVENDEVEKDKKERVVKVEKVNTNYEVVVSA